MTENLLEKLEEKVMFLLSELDILRNEITQLRQENSSLKAEKTQSIEKLQGLITLFDSVDSDVSYQSLSAKELEVLHGEREYV